MRISIPISWKVALLCIFASLIAVSCSAPGYEYYLEKDESHWDVYKISASISSDGTCSFAVDGDEAENYSSLHWAGSRGFRLDTIGAAFEAHGFCEKSDGDPPKEPAKYVHTPSMFVDVYTPKNIISTQLERGLPLDVKPIKGLVQGNNPPGVYFSIDNPKSVRRSLSPICNRQTLYSLKGTANLSREPDGAVTLTVIALGYVGKDCF